jgi:hypothetical protein
VVCLQGVPPGVYGSTFGHTAGERAELRALPARPELHPRFYGVTAEDVSAILARVNRGDRGRVD